MQNYVLKSQIIHRPLSLDTLDTFEENQQKKVKITKQIPIYGTWHKSGRGIVSQTEKGIRLTAEPSYDSWPENYPQDGDYVNYGYTRASLSVNADWQDYSQLKMTITNNCENISNPTLTIHFVNDGKIKIPDRYDREGYHVINLFSGTKEYVLDFSSLPRDVIKEISFTIGSNGSYMNLPGTLDVSIDELILEKSNYSLSTKGWHADKDKIIFSHIGYQTNGQKEAIISSLYAGKTFYLVEENTSTVVFSQTVSLITNDQGQFGILDFTDWQVPGTYHLKVEQLSTKTFAIKNQFISLLQNSLWKSLNFIFCERCGCPISGIHGTCHQDVLATHEGKKIIFNGGWHDAGDLSQQLVQTTEVTLALFLAAASQDSRDTLLAERLREEGAWGIDFILKTRLGQGFRATSAGVTRWTNNQLGDMDDVVARVHNSPYDNFLIVGCLAKILVTLPKEHELHSVLSSILEEDYQDAKIGFEQAPFHHEPIFWEHTYNTSKSLYLATLIWTNSLMYQATGKSFFIIETEKLLPKLLMCQEQTGISLDDGTLLQGFFYRDEQKKIIQHFNHQAREHLYAYAFSEAIKVVNKNLQSEIRIAARHYGDYLTYLASATAPYPMIASGIYKMSEKDDDASFHRQHLLVDEKARVEFKEQLLAGQKIAPGLYLKKFPVWFSFRGNNAVLLSMGESATIIGNLLTDDKLKNIGFKQLQWLIGKNPFGQSMMYGEGYNYPQMYTVSSGEMIGELPVGIQTFENQDTPYWPQFNNATYKEVWVGLAGKWLSVVHALSI